MDTNNEILADEVFEIDKSVEDDKEGARPVNEAETKKTHKSERSCSIDNESPKKPIIRVYAHHQIRQWFFG